MSRNFSMQKAVRGRSWLSVALVGPSGSGKTWSALALASGANKVSGGRIALIDTENERALRYAEHFDFDHIPFDPPFESEAYLDAIQYAVSNGAQQVIVDSMSHEHEGEGGVLQRHDAIANQLAERWRVPRDAANFSAWNEAKKGRRALLQYLNRNPHVDLFMCYRAKVKSKPGKDDKGRNVILQLGWQPIGAEELVYEMAAQCVLAPGSEGTPVWDEEHRKLPHEFRDILTRGQLSADMGEAMKRWSMGNEAAKQESQPSQLMADILKEITEADTARWLDGISERIAEYKAAGRLNAAELAGIRKAFTAKRAKVGES